MRERGIFARPEGKKSARLVVIAAEGRKTEIIYFHAVAEKLGSPKVHVEILERDSNNSSPESVYQQISAFKKEYNIEQDDQLWVVIDRDRWQEETISAIARYCQQDANLCFCVSNPCFELWLLLHLMDIKDCNKEMIEKIRANKKSSKSGDTYLKTLMRKKLGHYNDSSYDAEKLLNNLQTAITRAEALDTKKRDRWPQTLGTRAYLLVKSILNLKV